MKQFDFVRDAVLRTNLESDYRELRNCLEVNAFKAVHILAGSLVESLLIDALSARANTANSKLDELDLSKLIGLAKSEVILTEETESLSAAIRRYRNLIHPGRVKRLEKDVDKSSAAVVAELVEIIAREIEKHKKKTYGHTAEQLLERLSSGPSALPIAAHLIKQSHNDEVVRLMTDLIPREYQAAEWRLSEGDTIDPQLPSHLLNCYSAFYQFASEEVRKAVMVTIAEIYLKGNEPGVLLYEQYFVRATEFHYLDEETRRFVVAHILPRIFDNDELLSVLTQVEGITQYLETVDREMLIYNLIDLIASDRSRKEKLKVRGFLNREFKRGGAEVQQSIMTQIQGLIGASAEGTVLYDTCKRLEAEFTRQNERIGRIATSQSPDSLAVPATHPQTPTENK